MGGKSSKRADEVLEQLRRRRLELEFGRIQDEGAGYTCSRCGKRPQPHYRCHLGCDYDLCGRCRSSNPEPHPHPLCRERMSSNEKKQIVGSHVDNTAELLLNAFALYAKRPCFASLDASRKELRWLTFRDVYLRVCAVGRGVRGRLPRSAFVAIGGDNSAEWLICDYACQMFGLVSVPLHTHLPPDRLAFILEQCKPSLILCSRSLASRLAADLVTPVFLLDADAADPRSIAVLEAEGRARPLVFDPRQGDELLTVVWTSGSTGDSKGVMISERLYLSEINGPWFLLYDLRRVFFSPLAHTTDRKNATICLMNGGQSLLYPGPMDALFDAIALVQPTAFAAPPRMWNELYNQFHQALAAHLNGRAETEADRNKVRADMRRMLGGKVRSAATGGAPISEAVQKWIEWCFELELTVAYGSTESGGIASMQRARNGVEFRLLPLPELGYTPHDVPHPRGEIAVRKPGILGYWGDAARNAAAFTADGFYKTGDIGELRADGALAIVGRVGGAVKLAQSEWVNPEGIEAELSSCAWVQQIYVHAASIRAYVVAVVVPAPAALARFAADQALPAAAPRAELCARPDVRRAVLDALAAHATKAKLRSWEIPRAVLLEPERFALANGRLTPSHKLARAVLARAYADALDSLYRAYDAECDHSATALADLIAQSVARGASISAATRLADIGVDSLAALRLRVLLRARTGADVPLESLLGRPVGELCKLLAAPASVAAALPAEPPVDWSAEATLPPLSLPPAPEGDASAPCTVLLTGATGFVGAYILDALLRCGTPYAVVCLVRGTDDAHATQRLRETVAKYGLLAEGAALWERVSVAAGDVGEERLGLSEALYARLAASVSLIVHAGATVSAVLPYSHQRRANVVGTVNVLKFATAQRLKGVHHVSTMSVFSGAEKSVGVVDERTEPHVAHVASRPAYGQSKWVAEKLVRAAAKLGVPCAVYRLAGVAGASRRPYATNLSDFTFRLLVGCCQLGAAPDMPECSFDLTPVDWVAAALVRLMGASPRPAGAQATYHLTSPRGATSFRQLMASCERAAGPVKTVPFAEWRAMLDQAPATNVLLPLRQCFPAPLGGASNYVNTLTQQLLHEADAALHCRRLRTHRHLRWARRQGFMSRADAAGV